MENQPTESAQGALASEGAHGASSDVQAGDGAGAPAVSDDVLKKIAALEADNKKYRDERKQSRAQQQALLEEQGQYKALAESRAAELEELRAKVAELDVLRPHADAWTSYQEAEAARIAGRAQALDADERADLEAIQDIAARGRMLDRLLSKRSKAEPPKLGAPQNHGATSIDSMDSEQIIAAVKQDPSKAREMFGRLMRGGKRTRFG